MTPRTPDRGRQAAQVRAFHVAALLDLYRLRGQEQTTPMLNPFPARRCRVELIVELPHSCTGTVTYEVMPAGVEEAHARVMFEES